MSTLCPRQCMMTYGTRASATRPAIPGSARPPLTSLTSRAPALERTLGHPDAHRVDADGHARPRPARRRPGRPGAVPRRPADPQGARPGRLAADVDDVGACRGEREAVGDRRVGPEPLPAVGEGVRGDVDHAHDQAPRRGRGDPRRLQRVAGHGRQSTVAAWHGAAARPARAAVAAVAAVARRSRPRAGRRPSLRASRRVSSVGPDQEGLGLQRGQADRGASLVPGKTMNRGTQSGRNLALNRYSDSIWNHRDMKSRMRRQARDDRARRRSARRARARPGTRRSSARCAGRRALARA